MVPVVEDGPELRSEEVATRRSDRFDFAVHARQAEDEYQRLRRLYEDFTSTARTLFATALGSAGIKVQSVEGRTKTIESLVRKASLPLEADLEKPKYPEPLVQIKDLAALRVITFFIKNIQEVDSVIDEQFEIVEKADRSTFLRGGEKLGYESVHYIVRLNDARIALPEYAAFAGLEIEIQVRTILQHAWAEIEHDIQYKSVDELPDEIKRRFLALAGMLEIGDREFQGLSDAHADLRAAARVSVAEGRLADVEITPDSLKEYLDLNYGADGRMREVSYAWTTRHLKRLGFKNLEQLDRCIRSYDSDEVSRAIYGSRQGQLTRLDAVLLASMGENYVSPWANEANSGGWWTEESQRLHDILQHARIPVGSFSPRDLPL